MHSSFSKEFPGIGSQSTNEDLNISFAPQVPDYAGIAKAASGGSVMAEKVSKASDLEGVLLKAIECVKGGTTAVVDATVVPGC